MSCFFLFFDALLTEMLLSRHPHVKKPWKKRLPLLLLDFYTIYEWIFTRNVTDLHIMLDHRYTPTALVNCSIFGFAAKFPVSSFHAFSLSGLCRSFKGAHECSLFPCAGWENGSQPSSYHNTEVKLPTSSLERWAESKGRSLVKFRLLPNVGSVGTFLWAIFEGYLIYVLTKSIFLLRLTSLSAHSAMTNKWKSNKWWGKENRHVCVWGKRKGYTELQYIDKDVFKKSTI